MDENNKKSSLKIFLESLISGLGWSLGVTIGFAVVSTILVFALNSIGGLPVIGNWIADIVQETEKALLNKNPLKR